MVSSSGLDVHRLGYAGLRDRRRNEGEERTGRMNEGNEQTETRLEAASLNAYL